MRRHTNYVHKIRLTSLLEQIRPLAGTASPHLQKMQEAPLIVQVPLRNYRLAQDIFNTLHIGTGIRIDVNIWKFSAEEDLNSFVDSLILLGVPENVIVYPAGLLLKYQDKTADEDSDSSDDTENSESLSDLERDLGSDISDEDEEESSDTDFDAGFETNAEESENSEEEESNFIEEEDDLDELESELELLDLETAANLDSNEPLGTGEDLSELENELEDELAELEQELLNSNENED